MNEPLAWFACAADGSESQMVTLLQEEADDAAREWGWVVTPLFATAPLADDERAAVECGIYAIRLACARLPKGRDHDRVYRKASGTLRHLLARTKVVK